MNRSLEHFDFTKELQLGLFPGAPNRVHSQQIHFQYIGPTWEPTIFPPFGLIAKSLSKIRREVATVTFICPYWPSQFWFSTLLELSVDTPKMISCHPDLLLSCKRTPHPSIVDRSIQLVAWRLSGSDTRASGYRKKLSKFCWKDTVPIRRLPTSLHGSLGLVGIWNETKIPCERI